MKTRSSSIAIAIFFAAGAAHAEPFSYSPPGELVTGSGDGRVDMNVYAPGIRFPIEDTPAYANSQVWGVGGSQGPAGSQCDAKNYGYPWHDNYCETRSWDMPLCPAGTGHQGQDIRPGTCEKDLHPGVAVADGTITSIGSYSVYLTTADGTRFDYLHMSNVMVTVGQKVARGDVLGLVSNQFNGTPTTTHLHFNIQQNVAGVGTVYVPPYMSLIQAYQALIGPANAPGKGTLEAAACDGIRGFAQDPDTKDAPIAVRLSFDGATGTGAAEADVLANQKRDDLCASLGSCDHGFVTTIPASLMDGLPHEVHAYAVDANGGQALELDGSPMVFTCALPLPKGVRRHVIDPASFASWGFDELWDVASVDDSLIDALPVGDDLPSAPDLARADDGSAEVFLLDGPTRRSVKSEEVAAAWSFDLAAAPQKPAAELSARAQGPDVRPRPFVLKGSTPELWLVDDPLDAKPPGQEANAAGDETTSAAGCGCLVLPRMPEGASWLPLGAAVLALVGRRASQRARRPSLEKNG